MAHFGSNEMSGMLQNQYVRTIQGEIEFILGLALFLRSAVGRSASMFVGIMPHEGGIAAV